MMEFGDEQWMEEEERRQQEKLAKYEGSLKVILQEAMDSPGGEISLEELKERVAAKDAEFSQLIPNVQIFKEIMVELLRGREIQMGVLREERRNYISEVSGGFQLNEMLLNLTDTYGLQIQMIEVYRMEDGKVITFEAVPDETGRKRNIRCSNVLIRVKCAKIF